MFHTLVQRGFQKAA